MGGEEKGDVRYGEHFLVGLAESVDALFELEVVVWELGLGCVSGDDWGGVGGDGPSRRLVRIALLASAECGWRRG